MKEHVIPETNDELAREEQEKHYHPRPSGEYGMAKKGRKYLETDH